MTDRDLIEKKLAQVARCVEDLRRDVRLDRLRTDLREERFVEHTLQIAIQSALDAASHIVSDSALGEPSSNRDLFAILARHDWVDAALAARLEAMAGFRNVLVHGYQDVNLDIVEDVVRHRLGDLLDFVVAIRGRI